jgi:hypothetical protein
MARKLFSVLLLAMASATSSVTLADYTVQIGAYAKPELADGTAAANVAEVYTRENSSGLTRVLVGRFSTHANARAALEALTAAGYNDAFITRSPDGAPIVADTRDLARVSTSKGPDMRWSHLSEALRAKLVLLDGEPHIKDGDTFTPLDQYLSQ